MTVDTETTEEWRTEIEDWRRGDESIPLRDESNEQLALALEGMKFEAKESVDEVTRALLNEDEPLTEAKVERLVRSGEALRAVLATLAQRVPDEQRTDEWGG